MPLHPKAKEFAKNGLFAGLSSFEELEKRIAAIPENKGKGDAFEVFAEAYLATQRKHDAHQVWPLNAAPLDVLGKLGLGGMDYGVDGVLQTLLGDLSAYQVKFRTGREPMTWRELSTFMGLADSPHIRSRILITNCDELPPVINDRQGFFCIRGSDLDRMEAADFQAIEAWLAEAAIQAPKKKPLPHQEEALSAIVPTLQKESRATAIMACGTGKTLVTLWTAEQLGTRKILVLLPSLALLRQTLHEWLKETSLDPLAYLCVCSDPTVKADADEISTSQSDLDFEVSTDAATVRQLLDAPFKGTKVIFSTYQSASVVGEAMKPEESFDLGIFDEAHKTAGREGRNYVYALEDKNIAIRKRLFVTATPRHYNPSKQTKEGEATIAFSMDDPKVYGEQCFTLSFSKAANLGIICGYKVIISVITSEQVTDELLSKGTVAVKGDEIRARQVANQIALRDAVAQYGVSKIFSFHSTVKSAASFVADGNEGVRTHLPEFSSLHVSGAMPTAHREKLMQEFRRIDRGVMSNARCLTEGVDVPAVDMVAFLSPKKSKVDIVQAIGRAMRKSPGKETGYVLIPLYLEQKAGESLEEAVSRANFEEVWDILQSLKEQDDVLADLIRDMSEAKGRGKGEKDNPLGDRIDFVGQILSLDELRESISTRTLERLESSWDTFYGKLTSFKERFGHCNIGVNWEEDNRLGSWAAAQRTMRNSGILSADRIYRLEKLGFIWDYQSQKAKENWLKWYRELQAYVKEYGNPHVPRTHHNTKLASWVWIQRQRKKGTYKRANGFIDQISPEQESLLLSIGFHFDAREDLWMDKLEELKIFYQVHHHFDVEKVDPLNSSLNNWVFTQRLRYSQKRLSQEKQILLNDIGFNWYQDLSLCNWNELFQLLIDYKTKYGDCNVPKNWDENKILTNWVFQQRRNYREKNISEEQVSLLENIGFSWKLGIGNGRKKNWVHLFNQLLEFKKKHGHLNISTKNKNNPQLGNFIKNTRSQKKQGTLSKERIAMLEDIGFKW
jgi:superfamily II DNA or RNA helicase